MPTVCNCTPTWILVAFSLACLLLASCCLSIISVRIHTHTQWVGAGEHNRWNLFWIASKQRVSYMCCLHICFWDTVRERCCNEWILCENGVWVPYNVAIIILSWWWDSNFNCVSFDLMNSDKDFQRWNVCCWRACVRLSVCYLAVDMAVNDCRSILYIYIKQQRENIGPSSLIIFVQANLRLTSYKAIYW